jgi:hypothetical protein
VLGLVWACARFFFLKHTSHSISFTRAQGIPKYKIGFGREKDGRVGRDWLRGFAHGPQLRAKGVFIDVALVMDYGQGKGKARPPRWTCATWVDRPISDRRAIMDRRPDGLGMCQWNQSSRGSKWVSPDHRISPGWTASKRAPDMPIGPNRANTQETQAVGHLGKG